MKKMILGAVTFVAALAAVAVQSVDASIDKMWLRGTTDKPALDYKPGEKMVFTIETRDVSGTIPFGEYQLKLERSGDDGKKETRVYPLPLKGGKLRYVTSLETNGFVRIYATVCHTDGQLVIREGRPWPYHVMFFDGGAGVNFQSLRGLPEPEDFDAFWAKRKARLEKLPIVADKKPVIANAFGTTYAVSVNCAGGRPATFYMSVPSKCARGEKVPAEVRFWGYSVDRRPTAFDPDPNIILVDMNPHGFELGREDEYYTEFYNSVKSGECAKAGLWGPNDAATYAMDVDKNSNPDTAYFAGMTWRVMRTLQYVKTLPGWDGKNLIARGGSQAGLQTIWAAALDHDVTEAHSDITWCCDIGGSELGRLRGDWYVRWVPALGYYDAANMAKRIPRTCKVEIPRAGLGDYICPPSGLAVMYNNLRCPKKIVWYQGSEHGYAPPPVPDETFVFSAD